MTNEEKTERCMEAARMALPKMLLAMLPFKTTDQSEAEQRVVKELVQREVDRSMKSIREMFAKRNEAIKEDVSKLPDGHQNIGEVPDRYIEPLGEALAANVLFKCMLPVGQFLRTHDESNFQRAGMLGMMLARQALGPATPFASVVIDYANWVYAIKLTIPEGAGDNLPSEIRNMVMGAALSGKGGGDLH